MTPYCSVVTAPTSSVATYGRSAGGGRNATGIDRSAELCSRRITVPAVMSPSRWLWRDNSMLMMPMTPIGMSQTSTICMNDRMAACRNRTGPPSTVTTRSPNISLPTVAPKRVSMKIG